MIIKTFKLPILYCSGILLRKIYFHFTEPRVSTEHHLGNTDPIPETLYPGAQRSENETPAPSADVRNTSGHASAPVCLHDVMFNEAQDNITFTHTS
jgi:hypothetical protein